MRKCAGNNTEDWGFDSIYDVSCVNCGYHVEFFKDEITRNCPRCKNTVRSTRKYFGCGQHCSSDSTHKRNLCPKFKKSKHRFVGNQKI
ncbi:hypothetical protein ACFL20_08820 [Spirochaetota bacterium]